MYILKATREAIINHAAASYPRESCGLIVNREYVECQNIAASDDEFIINPKCFIKAEKLGEIQAIVHSHPNASTKPSVTDLMQMANHNLPWVIVSYPEIDLVIHKPKPFTAPLVGREYVHGLLDCFSIVRDYYDRELGIAIDDFERSDLWWESADSQDLYMDNFKAQGFVEVNDLQRHDVILCRVQPTEFVNHALIYLGDDGELQSEVTEKVVGHNLILHHPYLRTSRREIYGNIWQERTVVVVRHKSLMEV